MKKSSFAALILGTISGVFFSLGMCMVTLPAWNAFQPGIVFGGIGLLFALVTVIVWRKMEKKAPVKITGKVLGTILLSLAGALAFGVGMCLVMVWGSFIPGIIVGLAGILALLCLIPVCRGLRQ